MPTFVWLMSRTSSTIRTIVRTGVITVTRLVVDRERVAALGLELVERPVASEEGSYARHDPDKLAQAILDIYRSRAVRIFHGARRYILEE